MAANNKIGGEWEHFLWIWNGGKTFGLRCDGNEMVVAADQGLGPSRPLVGNRPAVGGSWEEFQVKYV